MSDDPDEDEPTQETEQGHEIPVPKKRDVLGAFAKIARAGKGNGVDRKPKD